MSGGYTRVVDQASSAINGLRPAVEIQCDLLRANSDVVPGIQNEHGRTSHARRFQKRTFQVLQMVGHIVESDYIKTLIRER